MKDSVRWPLALGAGLRLPIKPILTTNKSKEERAYLITDLIEAGKVWLPKNAPWLEEFIEELSYFPHGKFTDQLDALTIASQFLTERWFQTKAGCLC